MLSVEQDPDDCKTRCVWTMTWNATAKFLVACGRESRKLAILLQVAKDLGIVPGADVPVWIAHCCVCVRAC